MAPMWGVQGFQRDTPPASSPARGRLGKQAAFSPVLCLSCRAGESSSPESSVPVPFAGTERRGSHIPHTLFPRGFSPCVHTVCLSIEGPIPIHGSYRLVPGLSAGGRITSHPLAALSSSCLWPFPRLVLADPGRLEQDWSDVCRPLYYWVCLLLVRFRPRSQLLGRKATEGKHHSHHVIRLLL